MGLLRNWLRRVSDGPRDLRGERWRRIVNQTNRFNFTLFLLATVAIAAIMLSGMLAGGGVEQIIWGIIGAFASATVGAAFGVLFGLPTVESKRAALSAVQAAVPSGTTSSVSAAAAGGLSPSASGVPEATTNASAAVVQLERELDTGYRDSTSLEQIADWLTKIIVGLTLTQFSHWEDAFEGLASNLTEAMLTRSPECAHLLAGKSVDLSKTLALPACQPSTIPGGVIIALFATGGFLAAYLWMRRYFIIEMVMAKRSAVDLLSEKARAAEVAQQKVDDKNLIDTARQASLVEESVSRQPLSDPQAELEQILDNAQGRLAAGSAALDRLGEIRKKVSRGSIDPDDPWRGQFGDAVAISGVRLEASVAPLTDNPMFFRIDLRARADSATRAAELLGTKVLYFLHPTFSGQPRLSVFGADGSAPLELFAYGAFTVGALLEDGTMLELNLATLPGAPARFIAQ